MLGTNLMIDLVVVSIAALVGGLLAQRSRLPLIIGFLVAGVAIRPLLSSANSEFHGIQTLADIGVALLMFALGTEFSLRRLRGVGPVAVFGGAIQVAATIAFGWFIGTLLGFDWLRSLYWGCLISLSSTMVVLKLLQTRRELDTLPGNIAVGMLIMQDLAVVPMSVILPSLAGSADSLLPTLAVSFAKAAALILAVYFLGNRLTPWLLHQIASRPSRELMSLAVIGIGLGMALATNALGLSIAFGAFLAGLVIAETEYQYEIAAEVRPMRDIFASLFFVSIGMLIDPAYLWQQAPLILALVAAVALGKFIIVAAVCVGFSYLGLVAVPVGLSLLQIGEFSFVLAQLGVARGVIPESLYSLTLAVSLGTILLTPLSMAISPRLAPRLNRLPLVAKVLSPPPTVHGWEEKQEHRRGVVVLGYGRIGRELAEVLEARGFTWLAVDMDVRAIHALRARGIPCIYGDASEREVLHHAGLERAQMLAIALSDPIACERAVKNARAINPNLHIIVRARDSHQIARLVAAGAEEVVHPEFEAGMEFVRFALRRYGLSGAEVQHLLSGRRLSYYMKDGGSEG